MAADKDNDRTFEEYLEGDSGLSRRYRESSSGEPPKRLDDAILKAAHDSVKQSNVRRLVPRRWYKPVSMAALVVMCVSIVFTLYEETGPSRQAKIPADGIPEMYTDSAQEPGLSGDTGETAQGKSAPPEAKQESRALDKLMQEAEGQGAPAAVMEEDSAPVLKRELPAEFRMRESTVQDAAPAASANSPEPQLSAEEWLDRISELWRAGKKEEATAELEKFVKGYPDYPKADLIKQLPEDIDLTPYLE